MGLLSFGRSWSIEIAGYKKFYWRRQSAERSPGLLWRNCRATGPCLGRCAIATRRIPGFGKCRSAKGRRFAFGEAFDFRWDTVKVVNLIIDKLSYNFERLAARKSFCACHLHGCQNAFGFCNANETCAKRCLSLPFWRNQGRDKSLAPMRAAFENTEISKDDISWNCGGKRVSMKKCDCQFKGVRERVKALLRFHRPRRPVRRGRGNSYVGKFHFPTQKSLPGHFRVRKFEEFQRKLQGVAGAGESAGFCGFAKGKTAALQILI